MKLPATNLLVLRNLSLGHRISSPTSYRQYYRTFSSTAWRGSRSTTSAAKRTANSQVLVATLASLGALGWLTFHSSRAIHADDGGPPSLNPILDSRDKPTTLMSSKSVESFSQASVDVDSVLQQYAQSHSLDPSSGIKHFDVAQLSSNGPSEDDHSELITQVPFGVWSFFSVLDGHVGWETSAWLREYLILAVVGSLADLYEKYGPQKRPSSEEVDANVRDTFLALDKVIVQDKVEEVFRSKSKHAASNLLATAYAGSCALLAFYDSESKQLKVALTGDSRAVLGRRLPDGTFATHVLTADQNGENTSEKARLEAEHPGEEITNGSRVLGWGLSRAFGDARMKWSLEIQEKLKKDFLGRTPYKNVKTPPYFTAEPVITTIKIEPGDFLIMATDGIWEALSNEDAVGLVGLWVQSKAKKDPSDTIPDSGVTVFERSALPVKYDTDGDSLSERHQQWGESEKKFVNVDDNAAVHVLRNALGGGNTDLTKALLSMRPPRSRNYHDDLTATVVFFS